MSASKLQTSTKQEMFHTLFGDDSFSVKTSQLQTDIRQEMFHTLFGDYSYTTKTLVDIDDESITGKPILNCHMFRVKKDKSKLIMLKKKKCALKILKIRTDDISWGITFCLNHCITLLEEAIKPNQVEVITSLKVALIGLCKVQRIWRAILRYKILCFMHLLDNDDVERYLFDDTDNCRFLFTNKHIVNLKRYTTVPIDFNFHDTGDISYKSDIHKQSVEWIMNGLSEEMQYISAETKTVTMTQCSPLAIHSKYRANETPNKSEYICTPLALPKFQHYTKKIHPRKYAKIRYRFIQNLYAAIEAFWSAKYWYVAKNGEQGELLDKIDDVCHVSCFVKRKIDKFS